MASRAPEQSWQEHLRARGHRLTPQRELVLDAVDRLGHGTPEEIHAAVSQRSAAINISTVYRTLTLLDDLGLIRHVFLTDRTPVYHSRAIPAHVHLACGDCGEVIDAEPEEFADLVTALAKRHDFEVDLERLVVAGRCRACRDRTPDGS